MVLLNGLYFASVFRCCCCCCCCCLFCVGVPLRRRFLAVPLRCTLTRGPPVALLCPALPLPLPCPQLLNFVLVNIFVAIILDSYAAMLKANPAANDSSKFIAMVIMTAKKGINTMLDGVDAASPVINPHVIDSDLPDISGEEFWDIFDGYFGTWSILAATQMARYSPDWAPALRGDSGAAARTQLGTFAPSHVI
eukprot:SAG22_NODE_361_length_11712_cov_6.108155_9_plen_194_part_00